MTFIFLFFNLIRIYPIEDSHKFCEKDRDNEQIHQKSGQFNKNVIFGDFLNSWAL